jgi:hypothetical protein
MVLAREGLLAGVSASGMHVGQRRPTLETFVQTFSSDRTSAQTGGPLPA